MRIRIASACTLFACTLGLAAPAHAQVFVAAPPAPPIYVPAPPPIYLPAPPPPHVYIRQRIRWHVHRALAQLFGPAPQVYVQAPPVYVPAPPVYAEPPPMPLPVVPPPIVAPPVYYAPAPTVTLVQPAPAPPAAWSSRIGLGVRGTGQVINDGWSNIGIGGEFLYRVSPHLSTELAAEYQKNTDGNIDRRDIPVTFGLRIHIGRPDWVVSPYFVLAAGVDFATQDLKIASDDAFYVDGQLGGGLELRLGQHVAITADARVDAKARANDTSQAVASTKQLNGKPVHALDDEVGGQFRLGFAVYF